MATTILMFPVMVVFFYAPLVYIIILIVKALRKYLKSADVRKEKNETKISLGEALKTYRTNCKMMQHALKLWNCLHPADVGAVFDRPRAIKNRPYGFYCEIFLFCNRPLLFC